MNRSIRSLATLATAASLVTASIAVGASTASAATSRSFTCSGIISRNYTLQTVTGTITGLKPTNTTVFNYLGVAQVSTAAPARTNGWWGGYWKANYALNQWKVGTDAGGTVYHLMLPDTRMGGTFDALLVSEFGGGSQGNWQNWMTCTAA